MTRRQQIDERRAELDKRRIQLDKDWETAIWGWALMYPAAFVLLLIVAAVVWYLELK